ncbi:MAG TPA: hypothetical protein VFP10_08390, partial [Candidatus Eisenbacteria bacterium]|nr:hypothetical protein [Candidatus Eisenbacteria bacterium]
MKTYSRAALVSLLLSILALPALAQPVRKDVIWARVASGPITLNGILNEPSWGQAESVLVRYGQENGIPGSGWKPEAGISPINPTNATLKFLT